MLTHVVLTGLILIEATKNNQGQITDVTAYVVKTDGQVTAWGQSYDVPTAAVAGSPATYTSHHSELVISNSTAGGDLAGSLVFSAPGDGYLVDTNSHLLDLGAVYRDFIYADTQKFPMAVGSKGHDLEIRPLCKAPNPLSSCVKDGKPLMAARVQFKGAWLISGAEVDETRFSQFGMTGSAAYGFAQLREKAPPLVVPGVWTFENSVMLTSVEGPATAVLNNNTLPLATEGRTACFARAGDTDPCSLVYVRNHLHTAEPSEAPMEEGFHWHTDAYFDLLRDAPSRRVVSFTRIEDRELLKALYPKGMGTSAGKPCPPTGFIGLR
jgi:hypothetical protein